MSDKMSLVEVAFGSSSRTKGSELMRSRSVLLNSKSRASREKVSCAEGRASVAAGKQGDSYGEVGDWAESRSGVSASVACCPAKLKATTPVPIKGAIHFPL